MFDSKEELLNEIRLGEDSSLELRGVAFMGQEIAEPSRDELADELSSMANTGDCVLVLGADGRTRDITGIPLDRLDAVDRYVSEICECSIEPPLFFRLIRMELPDSGGSRRPLIKVEVPRSPFVHRSPGGYFRREGNSKREMQPEQLAGLFRQRSGSRFTGFEQQPVPGSGTGDLSRGLWKRYAARFDKDEEVSLMKRRLLSKDDKGDVSASVAGILFCCEHPEKFLPNACIDAARYRGTRQNSGCCVDARRIYGPLDRQIKKSLAFFRRNQSVAATKEPNRTEKPQFSGRAVFEAVVNAVAHRDYSVFGSKIRFFMFDDRLEIYSPGNLPDSVTVDSIHLRQSSRNGLISDLLAETPVAETAGNVGRSSYMGRRGGGVPIILDESERLSGKKPVYSLIDGSELLLTIYSRPAP